jgi:dipeptidyl-peptidase 4
LADEGIMMNIVRIFVALAVLAVSPAFAQDAPPEAETAPPITTAEVTDFTRTMSYDQVRALFDSLAEQSDRVRLDTIGTTNEGREIPLVIIADPPVEKPEDVKSRTVVFLFGNIHAGEVCGKEALSMLARQLALTEDEPLLENLVICIVPIYNADGNERFAKDNRPGQHGPEEMGQRENAQGLDLNRDSIKLEAPETRALVRFMNKWDPAVIVDTHTTNGSHHRYTITYQGPKNPAGDAEVISFVRDTMLPAVGDAFKNNTGYNAFFYGYFADRGTDHAKWVTYPDWPRYGTAYRGMRNRVAILSEAYAYASFKDRVLGTLGFCREVLNYTDEHRDEITKLIKAADDRTITAGREPNPEDTIVLRTRVKPFDDKVTILGYEETREEGKPVVLGDEVDYEAELVNDFEATLSVRRPYAYAYPASLTWLTEHLQRQGLKVEVLREDIELDIEQFRVESYDRAENEFEGHKLISNVRAALIPTTHRAKPGTMIVRTGQKLGTLGAYMLEPQAEDGLVAWNFFDEFLDSSEPFPVIRIPEPTPMTLRDAPPLPEDRKTDRRLTYDNIYGDKSVDLDGGAVSGLKWHDERHYIQRKAGQRRIVDAVSGRSEPAPEPDFDAIATRLAQVPTIDDDQAGKLARRRFARPNDLGVVFTHQGDLYFAGSDGSHAKRLTASPEAEEIAELAPDGTFVAFVRSNDLWVVDVETATQRALTTGGTDTLRHGKHTWVYYEELYGRRWKAYWWSPDSRHIAYFTTDSSMVPEYALINDIPRKNRLEIERYPRPGEPNPSVRLSIVSAAGGTPRPVDLSAYDEGAFLISWIGWSKSTGKLRFAVQDRVQTWLDLLEAPPSAGQPEKLMRETTEAWVEPQGNPRELKDGSYILRSERDGFKHLYHFNKDGSLKAQITKGEWEVRNIEHIDENTGWIYFTGTVDSPIASNLYRVRLDGTDLERLTREQGSHRITLSEDARLFIDSWSTIGQPTRVALRAADGTLVRMIDTNPVYELDEWTLPKMELVEIPSEKGVNFEGLVIYPADFDKTKTYPVWFKTYGGPHAPTVYNAYAGGRLSDRLLAEKGIIVFRADPYPASGKGAKSTWTTYQNMGVRELEDLTEIITWITDKPWADGSRVGMSGHSFGGYLTAYAMTHSDLFSAGIAGAPPTDWRDYDTIYTERYMRTPQTNPQGYKQTSVIEKAGDLHGNLLLIHGMIDDNVHPQNSVRLINALVKANKQFEMFMYPGKRHGVWSKHYSRLLYDFILEQMNPEQTPEPHEPSTPDTQAEPESPAQLPVGPGAPDPRRP